MIESLAIVIFIAFIGLVLHVNINERKGCLFTDFNAIYIGGLPNITSGSNVQIVIKDDKFVISKKLQPVKEIFKTELVNAEIMSEHQIAQKISLGKMFVFGIFSFGMKKNKLTFENYLVITYSENNENRQLVLRPSSNLERTVKIFNNYIGTTSY